MCQIPPCLIKRHRNTDVLQSSKHPESMYTQFRSMHSTHSPVQFPCIYVFYVICILANAMHYTIKYMNTDILNYLVPEHLMLASNNQLKLLNVAS